LSLNNSLFVGKVFLDFDTLPSTNEYAMNLLSKSKPSEGTVISTRYQSAGRGQYGSDWHSESGKAITLSVIFYPLFLNIRKQFDLNMAIALGVYDCLRENCCIVDLSIKWPNDIYVGNSKLGGILIQNTISKGKITASVVGIGLNLNQHRFPNNLPNPTSILLESGIEHDRDEFINQLCSYLESYYLLLKASKIGELRERYYKALYNFQISTEYERTDGSRFKGVIRGIRREGRLCVENEDGVVEAFGFKEIKWVG